MDRRVPAVKPNTQNLLQQVGAIPVHDNRFTGGEQEPPIPSMKRHNFLSSRNGDLIRADLFQIRGGLPILKHRMTRRHGNYLSAAVSIPLQVLGHNQKIGLLFAGLNFDFRLQYPRQACHEVLRLVEGFEIAALGVVHIISDLLRR